MKTNASLTFGAVFATARVGILAPFALFNIGCASAPDILAPIEHVPSAAVALVRVAESRGVDELRSINDHAMLYVPPSGRRYRLTFDRVEAGYGGTRTWIGYLSDHGKRFRIFISKGNGFVTGTMATPEGHLRLEGPMDAAQLTNIEAAGIKPLAESGHVHPASPVHPTRLAPKTQSALTNDARENPTPLSQTTIDILVLFTNGYAARNGTPGTTNRLNQMVAMANQAFIDSEIAITLRTVGQQQVAYPDNDSKSIQTALQELTPKSLNGVVGQYAGALRNQLGADLVTLIREFKDATAGACGTAWAYGNGILDADYGYSVVEDGTASNVSCGLAFDGHDFPHEIGHNLGSVHDACSRAADPADTSVPTQPYNKGYCSGTTGFSTIMATVERIASGGKGDCCAYPFYLVFSNPNITTCGGSACGIDHTLSNGADEKTAFDLNRDRVAKYRNSKEQMNAVLQSLQLLLD